MPKKEWTQAQREAMSRKMKRIHAARAKARAGGKASNGLTAADSLHQTIELMDAEIKALTAEVQGLEEKQKQLAHLTEVYRNLCTAHTYHTETSAPAKANQPRRSRKKVVVQEESASTNATPASEPTAAAE